MDETMLKEWMGQPADANFQDRERWKFGVCVCDREIDFGVKSLSHVWHVERLESVNSVINYQTQAPANSSSAARDSRGPDCDRPDPWTNARDGCQGSEKVQGEREVVCAHHFKRCALFYSHQEYRE